MSTRIFVRTSIVALFAALMLSGCSKAPEIAVPAGMKAYTDGKTGISLAYPENWEQQAQPALNAMVFLSPQEGSDDLFRENVNVIAQDLSAQPMNLEQYTDLSINQIKQLFTDVNIEKQGDRTISDIPGKTITYSGTQGQLDLKWMQWWGVKGNTAYIYTYTAGQETYDKFADTSNKMLDSLTIQ